MVGTPTVGVIRLVLVLSYAYANQDNVLADLVGLLRLDAWDYQQWHSAAWLFTQQDWANKPLGY